MNKRYARSETFFLCPRKQPALQKKVLGRARSFNLIGASRRCFSDCAEIFILPFSQFESLRECSPVGGANLRLGTLDMKSAISLIDV